MNEVATIPARRVSVVQYEVSDIERMAKAIAGSKLFGMSSPEQALALCLIAQSEGRHPASAAQDYHIIQGKPSKKSDAMLRDFLSAGGKVEWHSLDDTTADATFSHPAGGSARITWDMARARKAQLSTPMWTKYPRQMLRSRVVSEGVRTVFPMATSGMYVPEEVQDFAPRGDGEIDGEPVPQIARQSSHRLKQEGGDDVFKSITEQVNAATSVADLQAIHKTYALTIAKWPPDWQASFTGEIYTPKLEELREAAKHRKRSPTSAPALSAPSEAGSAETNSVTDIDPPLTEKESGVVRAGLLSGLYKCETAADIDEWQTANRATFRKMLKGDQQLIVHERDAILAEWHDKARRGAPDDITIAG